MSRLHTPAAWLLATVASVSAQAASQIDQVALSCSDTLNIEGVSALSLRCAGDFTLSGQGTQGTISADESLTIWAAGRLVFEDVSLNAPLIDLRSETLLSFDSASQLNGSSITLRGDVRQVGAGIGEGGSVSLSSGSDLSIGSPTAVPEPNTAMLSLTAIALAGMGRLFRSRSR